MFSPFLIFKTLIALREEPNAHALRSKTLPNVRPNVLVAQDRVENQRQTKVVQTRMKQNL